jgi:hypothetical protein
MSVSEQYDRVAIVPVEYLALIGKTVNLTSESIWFNAIQGKLGHVWRVPYQVAQYTEPTLMVQMLCNHSAQNIAI